MFFRRLIAAVFWIVLVLYVVHDPAGAAHTARDIGDGLSNLADGLDRFLRFL